MKGLTLAKNKSGYSSAAQNRIKNYSAKQSLQGARQLQRRKDNVIAVIASTVAIIFAIGSMTVIGLISPTPSPSASVLARVPDKSLAENRQWTGTLQINDYDLGISLDGEKAPQAVANFVSLVKAGFYNGLSCHRLTTAGIYVLQCGDPNGDGTGGPGYNWGPIENAPADNTYKTGVLAMARRSGDANSMGSQFFIVYSTSQIPADAAGGYTVFGSITSNGVSLEPIITGGVVGDTSDGAPKVATTINSIQVN